MEQTISEIREKFAFSRFRKESSFYRLKSLTEEYPAWVVRFGNGEYGVAIPYQGDSVNEDFNEISLLTDEYLIENQNQKVLMLTSETEVSREQFAVFCFSLVNPGKNGEYRKQILADPFKWWKEWKELVGNSAVNKKPYSVIGELIVLRDLLKSGKEVHWGGPDAASRDIEMVGADFEVKSTLNRYGKSITISSQFQLSDSDKETYLVFNRFEQKANDGISINSVVREIITDFPAWEEKLEKRLKKLGYKTGKSAREESYLLIEQRIYLVDENFPKINETSFVGGEIPQGITRIEYTVDLDACPSHSLTEKTDWISLSDSE